MEEVEKEIIEWGKANYPQYLENVDLLKSLYKRQVKKEGVGYVGKRQYPFRRVRSINVGERVIAKVVVVEIRKKGEKNKKWTVSVLGDNSGMIIAMVFQDKSEADIEEGKEYIVQITRKDERSYTGDIKREVKSKDESIGIDTIYDYIFDLNGGRVNAEKLKKFVAKRGLDYDEVRDLFSLREDGDMIIGK